jgi:AbrB family looped-hinge helix DNA binding protein
MVTGTILIMEGVFEMKNDIWDTCEGFNRRIDDLGRVIIPKSIRKELNVDDGQMFSFFIQDGKIVLEKVGEPPK